MDYMNDFHKFITIINFCVEGLLFPPYGMTFNIFASTSEMPDYCQRNDSDMALTNFVVTLL